MRVLIIEDDNKLRKMLKEALSKAYLCDCAATISDAVELIESYAYHGVLLDRDIDGIDDSINLISKIKSRSNSCAIIIASAYSGVEERLSGLINGADDYIEKPYDLRELKIRLDLLIRRNSPKKIIIGLLEIDLENKTITYSNNLVILTKKESDLIFFLASNPNKILTRDDISHAIYTDPLSTSSNTIDAIIKNIRKKLIHNPIETIKGRGYVFKDI